jgi:hypothetical protein
MGHGDANPDRWRWVLLRERLRVIAIGVGLTIVGLAAAFLWFSRIDSHDALAAAQCRERYRVARTAAESTLIDAQRPLVSKGNAPARLPCRTLRERGLTQ